MDREAAVVLVIDVIVDSQDRNINCMCPCSRPGKTNKDRSSTMILLVDFIVVDQDIVLSYLLSEYRLVSGLYDCDIHCA